MKHADKIDKIIVRTEFKHGGRVAYVETEVRSTDELQAGIALGRAIDMNIDRFIARHPIR